MAALGGPGPFWPAPFTPGPPASSALVGFWCPGLCAPGRHQSGSVLRPSNSRKTSENMIFCCRATQGLAIATFNKCSMEDRLPGWCPVWPVASTMSATILWNRMLTPLCWYPAPACDGTAGTTYRACFGPAALWNALSFDYMQSILLMCLPDPLPDAAGLQTRLHLSGRAYSGRCSVLISAGPAQTARYGHFSYTAGAHSAPHIPCRTLLMPWRGPPHIYCCGRGFQMYSTPSACVVS